MHSDPSARCCSREPTNVSNDLETTSGLSHPTIFIRPTCLEPNILPISFIEAVRAQLKVINQPNATPFLVLLLQPPHSKHHLGSPLIKHVLKKKCQKAVKWILWNFDFCPKPPPPSHPRAPGMRVCWEKGIFLYLRAD
eukprot:GFUD01083233.1.p1 GENE.GFUD01083233.1~~GFUD01083233.1.p1  ORF type:complete len:152 (-),score=27.38 GFUD01083233.1:219-632(-)